MTKSILEDIRQPKMVFDKTHQNAMLPKKAHSNDEGWDVFAVNDQIIPPKSSGIVDIGLKLAYLDEGYWIKVESRSGLAFKNDIVAFQGVIDNGYRGNVGIKLFNFSDVPYEIKIGDRIAQLTIKYSITDFGVEWGKSTESSRGSSGFGSTGK